MSKNVPQPLPRPEYPRPQSRRDQWLNLNGEWEFEFDPNDSGYERGLVGKPLNGRITVPFAPESTLSGIGDTDFHEAVWYHRHVVVPEDWAGKQLLLHFGAVDHDATVWVNGIEVVRHRGGFTPFSANVTDAAHGSTEFDVTVRARDSKTEFQARGKQSTWYANSGCFYTRTTGIWQTVWIEPVDPVHIRRVDITPNVGGQSFTVTAPVSMNCKGYMLTVSLYDHRSVRIAEQSVDLGNDFTPQVRLIIPDDNVHLWDTENPYLYKLDLAITTPNGRTIDYVRSYAGLRSVTIDGPIVHLNGKPVFQRLVLDQGYWPDGLMTAPTDEALIRDIKLGKQAGFNGARLHQKAFEERYLYHADRLGYLVWGEFGDWGVSTGMGPKGNNQHQTASFITQWLEELLRDYSHPAIIGWCPLNETYQILTDHITQLDDVTRGMFLAAKAMDVTRPVLDASGYSHRVLETDVYDSHNYEQDPKRFAEIFNPDSTEFFANHMDDQPISQPHHGQPYFVSEYGGIWWNKEIAAQNAAKAGTNEEVSWGYGDRIRTEEEFYDRFEGLTAVLARNPRMFGYCYTQLTDVFQEQNGLYDFERQPKFDIDRIRTIQETLARQWEASL